MIAKDPQPGRCKTRLCPPCSPRQAADLAEAALRDTLEVVRQTRGATGPRPRRRRITMASGRLEIVVAARRRTRRAAPERVADVAGPALLVGMDTPQLTRELLLDGIRALTRRRRARPRARRRLLERRPARVRPGAFTGVPMSRGDTLRHQRARLAELGLCVHEQAELRDVDTIADARAVAARGARLALRGAWRRLAMSAPSRSTPGRWRARATADPTGACRRQRRPLRVDRWTAPRRRHRRASARRPRRPGARRRLRTGRHLHALARRGIFGLGVDLSRSRSSWPAAVAPTRSSARSSTRCPAPAAGSSALLLDGNIGIGGDPRACWRGSRRCSLLAA